MAVVSDPGATPVKDRCIFCRGRLQTPFLSWECTSGTRLSICAGCCGGLRIGFVTEIFRCAAIAEVGQAQSGHAPQTSTRPASDGWTIHVDTLRSKAMEMQARGGTLALASLLAAYKAGRVTDIPEDQRTAWVADAFAQGRRSSHVVRIRPHRGTLGPGIKLGTNSQAFAGSRMGCASAGHIGSPCLASILERMEPLSSQSYFRYRRLGFGGT